jgi:hypothetical protein
MIDREAELRSGLGCRLWERCDPVTDNKLTLVLARQLVRSGFNGDVMFNHLGGRYETQVLAKNWLGMPTKVAIKASLWG